MVYGCSQPQSSSEPLLVKNGWEDGFPTTYDKAIYEASNTWLPIPTGLFGFTLLKAQYYQESLLDPNARSPAGAEGIAQFMPPTWEEIMKEMGYGNVDRTVASVAIQAGAYYMSKLRKGWTSERTEKERMELAQASYNAGFGGILNAQKRCTGLNWDTISTCAPKETQTYVERIWSYWKKWRIG